MLRITSREHQGSDELALSGSISGAWVAELRRICEETLNAGRHLILDLNEVAYADCAGLELLSELRTRTVRIFHWTPLVAELMASYEGRTVCRIQKQRRRN